jgi:hypothetical protein
MAYSSTFNDLVPFGSGAVPAGRVYKAASEEIAAFVDRRGKTSLRQVPSSTGTADVHCQRARILN